jgi:polyketide cyclase/dehydrase/lipid transport protein
MSGVSTETYVVERSTTIAADPKPIYDRLVDFRAWRDWSPWEDLDPDQQRTYSGADSGAGARYAWSGNRKAGQGRMEITRVQEPTEVTVALEFDKPFKSRNTVEFFLVPDGADRTRVRWVMTGPKTLATKLMGLFTSMDKMIGPDFEKGLARLKDAVETRST